MPEYEITNSPMYESRPEKETLREERWIILCTIDCYGSEGGGSLLYETFQLHEEICKAAWVWVDTATNEIDLVQKSQQHITAFSEKHRKYMVVFAESKYISEFGDTFSLFDVNPPSNLEKLSTVTERRAALFDWAVNPSVNLYKDNKNACRND